MIIVQKFENQISANTNGNQEIKKKSYRVFALETI